MVLNVLKHDIKFTEFPVKKYFHIKEGYSKITIQDWFNIGIPVLLHFLRVDSRFYGAINDASIERILNEGVV